MASSPESPPIITHPSNLLQLSNHDSDPTLRFYSTDLLSDLPLGPLLASLISLPPGTRTIPRAHSDASIFIYVLAGSGVLWHHGTPYDMAQNDCVGFKGGEGLTWAMINDGHTAHNVDFLVLSEKHSNDRIAFHGNSGMDSTWNDPPKLPLGTHTGEPTPPPSSSLPSSELSSSSSNPPPTQKSTVESFWPSTLFHSLVMGIPNLLPAPETLEVAPLSILSSLTSSAGVRYTVTQIVVQAWCRFPAWGPRAYRREGRMLWVCAASEEERKEGGGAKLWMDGEVSELRTGDCVRLEAGTGRSWCVLNEGSEELIVLEFAQDIDDDEVYFSLASTSTETKPGDPEHNKSEAEMRLIAQDELGKAWWEAENRPTTMQAMRSHPAYPRKTPATVSGSNQA